MSTLISRTFAVKKGDQVEPIFRSSRRVLLNADVIKAAKLSTGDLVVVAHANIGFKAFAVGVVWPSLDIAQDSIVLSAPHLLATGLKVDQRARVVPLSIATAAKSPPGVPNIKQPQEAKVVKLRELKPADLNPSAIASNIKGVKQQDWLPLCLREALVDLKYITTSQILDIVYEGEARRFSVESAASAREVEVETVTGSLDNLSLEPSPRVWHVTWDSTIVLLEGENGNQLHTTHETDIEHLPHSSTNEAYASVGGLGKQIEEIRDLLEIPLTRPDLFRHFGLKPPRGVLLHGPPGTGKTHLARAIASSTNSSVLVINGPELSSAYHGETESRLRNVFREAREMSPCIVVLDEVDALAPRREENAGGEVEKRVVATLLTLMDGMDTKNDTEEVRVIVIATTNRPNAIDPALRRPGRFDREIEIGVPDAEARLSILNVLLSKTPHLLTQDELRTFAAQAHGYVGADLSALVRQAGTIAIKRSLSLKKPTADPENKENARQVSSDLVLTISDLVAALPSVRPSAMRSLFVETPRMRYSDIGGQSAVIQKLRETVEWPLLHPETFQRLGVRPPKGILLYGPPGCSKTVLARACACESGVNFVAVKGPELLNKFVGESERAVREIFRKARAASPSIIFFDEIDALASYRTSSETDGGTSHEGVLTSLLNEMDGVQELVGVTVIAATNRPDALDSALMRPGRLDRILYVGPPDLPGRQEIFEIRLKNMTVGTDVDIQELAKLTEGCSGAEIAALCQEAAIITMQEDMNSPHIPHAAFVAAARVTKRQITPSVLQRFARWQEASQVPVS